MSLEKVNNDFLSPRTKYCLFWTQNNEWPRLPGGGGEGAWPHSSRTRRDGQVMRYEWEGCPHSEAE